MDRRPVRVLWRMGQEGGLLGSPLEDLLCALLSPTCTPTLPPNNEESL